MENELKSIGSKLKINWKWIEMNWNIESKSKVNWNQLKSIEIYQSQLTKNYSDPVTKKQIKKYPKIVQKEGHTNQDFTLLSLFHTCWKVSHETAAKMAGVDCIATAGCF